MKRKYIKPEMDVVILKQHSCLLAGSNMTETLRSKEEEVYDGDDFEQY